MLCTGDDATPRDAARRRRSSFFIASRGGVPVLIADEDPGVTFWESHGHPHR